jgi:hypothetical protein
MARRRFQSILHTAALVALLLFAQIVSISHVDLGDSHPAGEVCALCAVHANMGSANVSAATYIDVDVQRAEEIDYLSVQPPHRRVEFRFARGPPLVS